MKILTCIKQVPAKDSRYRVNDEGAGILEEDLVFETNESDLYALEEALRLKEKFGGEVIVLSLGPDRVAKALLNALAMGADRAIHLKDKIFEGGDAWTTAQVIAASILEEKIDLILTGVQSEDMSYAQTGTILAQVLGWSCATIVVEININDEASKITLKRELESNVFERIELELPVVLTIQAGINQIRYATLRGIMKAKKKEYKVITSAQLDLGPEVLGEKAAKVRHYQLLPPKKKKKTIMLEGTPEETVRALMGKLTKETRVL